MILANKLEDLVPNAQLGHYTIIEHVAEGGMGHVFKGFEASLSREVAIKVLKVEFAEDPEKLKAFDLEAQNIAALRHPNIVPVYFVGHEGELHYFVMPFITGSTLDDWVEGAVKMNADQATWVMNQAIDALDWAFQHKVIHLDIKPSNFLVDNSGVILLTDFGLARSMGGSLMANDDECFGTPAYMCPEQILQQETDQRSDIYSLGATIYHLMTTSFLYDSESVSELVQAHLDRPFPHQAAAAAGLSPGWITLLDKMTQKNPADRYQNYEELRHAVANVDRLALRYSSEEAAPVVKKIHVPIRASEPREFAYGLLSVRCASWTISALDHGSQRTLKEIEISIEKPVRPLAVTALVKPLKEIEAARHSEVGDLAEALTLLPEMDDFLQKLARTPFSASPDGATNRRKSIRALGTRLSSQLILTSLMMRNDFKPPSDFQWHGLWQHSINTGIIADCLLAVISGDFIPGKGWQPAGKHLTSIMHHSVLKARTQTYFAGLVHDIGKFILGEVAPYPYYCALRAAIEQDCILAEQEKKLMQMDHCEAGEQWLSRNGFDANIRQAASSHGDLEKKTGLVASAVALANQMAKIYGLGYSGNPMVERRDLWHTRAWQELLAVAKDPRMTPEFMEEKFLPLIGYIPLLAPTAP